MQYRWRIRVQYEHGRSQVWPCDTEAAARAEYAQLLAEQAAGEYSYVTAIVLERQPDSWEPVEWRLFFQEGGR